MVRGTSTDAPASKPIEDAAGLKMEIPNKRQKSRRSRVSRPSGPRNPSGDTDHSLPWVDRLTRKLEIVLEEIKTRRRPKRFDEERHGHHAPWPQLYGSTERTQVGNYSCTSSPSSPELYGYPNNHSSRSDLQSPASILYVASSSNLSIGSIRVINGDEHEDCVSEEEKDAHEDCKSEQVENKHGEPTRVNISEATSTGVYQYVPVTASEIRLLRISPGEMGDDMVCALKPTSLLDIKKSELSFQALSYAWGNRPADNQIVLSNIPCLARPHLLQNTSRYHQNVTSLFSVRTNLLQALKRIRQKDTYMWLWVDAICINQQDNLEKDQQIANMPEIYSNAFNVIAWLGEAEISEQRTQRALKLIPKILNLRSLDSILHRNASEEILSCLQAFGYLLQVPWFGRRWVIQEVACARKLSVRIDHHILSWIDFTDAVDIYVHNLGRIRELLGIRYEVHVSSLDCSRAMTLINLSRNCFSETLSSGFRRRVMSLENLVLAASTFAVSETRDTIYALLHLAHDRRVFINIMGITHAHQDILSSGYSRHAVDVFSDFVRYSMKSSRSLDVICRLWARWPRLTGERLYTGRNLPSWIGVTAFAKENPAIRLSHSQALLGTNNDSPYNASQGATMQANIVTTSGSHVLQTKGLILGLVRSISESTSGRVIRSDFLRLLGWNSSWEDGINDRLWRTLVMNRTSGSTKAPSWYKRACALAVSQLSAEGDLHIPDLEENKSQPGMFIDYLKRVGDVAEYRRSFQCMPFVRHRSKNKPAFAMTEEKETVVGIGPGNIEPGDLVCILFGCSVPVALRRRAGFPDDMKDVKFIGPCYVHGCMEGEMFAGLRKAEIGNISVDLNIS
jgi:hypothetical protein